MKFESMISKLDEDDREILRGLYGENGSLMLKKANTYSMTRKRRKMSFRTRC